MNKAMTLIAAVVVLSAITFGDAKAQSKPTAPDNGELAALVDLSLQEIKKLRLEILEQGIDFQCWKINLLEKELAQAQQELNRLREQEQVLRQRLANLNAQPAGQPNEMDDLRNDLSGNRLQAIGEKQQPLQQRETSLQNQLTEEKDKLYELLVKVRQMRANQ